MLQSGISLQFTAILRSNILSTKLYVPSVCPSHPLWDNKREGAGRPSERYLYIKISFLAPSECS